MAKSSTPTFITTIPLKVDSRAEAELFSRFQAGRQLYNAVLSEAMVRMNNVLKEPIILVIIILIPGVKKVGR